MGFWTELYFCFCMVLMLIATIASFVEYIFYRDYVEWLKEEIEKWKERNHLLRNEEG